jgi:tRNA(Ile)-lysidine synthetase-like protein
VLSFVPEGRVLVAVSGGPDSTALLLALREAGCEVVAAHYDHALRDGSEGAAAMVGELCGRLGVELVAERRSEPVPKGSLQAAARRLRYGFLERARVQARAGAVALAHTADDMVEGAVLHLMRGCGLAGLRGMPERRGVYLRPFLNVWRSDVEAYLAERGVGAYEDPANLDLRFARARVRHVLLPALERDRPGIRRRFHSAALAAARLQARAEGTPTDAERLKRLYAEAGGVQPGLYRRHLEAMLNLMAPGPGGRGVDLPGGLRFRIVGELMEVVPAARPALAEAKLAVSSCRGCAEPGAVHLRSGLRLHIGHRSPGLRIRPLGGRGTRKLQDVFVDARVPREDRDGWPLVFAGDRLAWVPGIAVDAGCAAAPGEPAVHVSIHPMPASSPAKVARLKSPTSRGDLH